MFLGSWHARLTYWLCGVVLLVTFVASKVMIIAEFRNNYYYANILILTLLLLLFKLLPLVLTYKPTQQ